MTADYGDGETVTNPEPPGVAFRLYPVLKKARSFCLTIPARATLGLMESGSIGVEIPYSITYTGYNADCVRVTAEAGELSDAFGNGIPLNCWNDRPTWFVMEGGGGTLNEGTGNYEGTGVITVAVLSAYLEGIGAGLYTGTLTVTVGFL